jgi:alcohol dehydrogenase class IV
VSLAEPFSVELPTTIRFGPGVRSEAGRAAAELGQRVAMLVGQSYDANPARADVDRSIADAGLSAVDRMVVHGEPDDRAVVAVAQRLAGSRVDVVVAVGGGSVIDLAKAAAVVAAAGGGEASLRALLGGRRVEIGVDPRVVALPTTAGSGAEASHGAIVLDRQSGRKRGIRGPGVAARVALVDPELGASAPRDVTATSGFDAMAHAIETSVSRKATPFTELLAADALRRLLASVPAACDRPGDAVARSEAAYAAMLMGINLALSTTCLPHRLQYPVGALTGTAHARGVAALFPAWLARTLEIAPDRLARLAVAAGLSDERDAPERAAGALVTAVEGHLAGTGMRAGLGSLGVTADDIPALVAAVEGTLTNDPGPVGPDDLAALYRASL